MRRLAMYESHSVNQTMFFAGSEDVRRIFRGLDDRALAAVLSLRPTVPQLEEAASRAGGASDIFANIRPSRGVVEAIVEIVGPEDDELG
jgi:hypothetical protein